MTHQHKNIQRVVMEEKPHTHTRTNRNSWKIIPICISSFDAVMETVVTPPARLLVLITPTQDLRMLGSVNNI